MSTPIARTTYHRFEDPTGVHDVLKVRTDDQISDVDGGWFRARWHYSFDTYVDPEYTSFPVRAADRDGLRPTGP